MSKNVVKFRSPKAYHQTANVFLEEHKNTSIKLAKGERLFILTDGGIEESPYVGPNEVLIITEHFGTWPVVAFAIPARDVAAWRAIDPEKSAPKMMARVRAALGRHTTSNDPHGSTRLGKE